MNIDKIWNSLSLNEKLLYNIQPCPICGHLMLDCYSICEHCKWEFDGIFFGYSPTNKQVVGKYRTEYIDKYPTKKKQVIENLRYYQSVVRKRSKQ